MSTTTSPTAAQIAAVQANLQNMQAFNDYVYNQGQSKIINAYALLSQTDNSDPGVKFGLSILEKAFSALMSSGAAALAEPAPIVGMGTAFLTGMLGSWSAAPPGNLDDTFSTLLIRVQETSMQVDSQLATYYADVAGNWDVSFTANGQTVALSDLADPTDDGTFPTETDPEFESLAGQALFAFDQGVWQYVLVACFYCVDWESAGNWISGKESEPPTAWVEQYYKKNPAWYMTWTWGRNEYQDKCWLLTEYSVGGLPSPINSHTISNAAAAYLFIDGTPGTVLNAQGLFMREMVFTGLGLRVRDYCPPVQVVTDSNTSAAAG
jgi:hypothetical protein